MAEATLAPAEDLPLDDASVDAVLVGQAWHWFDQEKALAHARRVTKPGGWLGENEPPHAALTTWGVLYLLAATVLAAGANFIWKREITVC